MLNGISNRKKHDYLKAQIPYFRRATGYIEQFKTDRTIDMSNLYPVGSVTACDGDLCREQESKFLLCHRLRSPSVGPFDLLDGLLKENEGLNFLTNKQLSNLG